VGQDDGDIVLLRIFVKNEMRTFLSVPSGARGSRRADDGEAGIHTFTAGRQTMVKATPRPPHLQSRRVPRRRKGRAERLSFHSYCAA